MKPGEINWDEFHRVINGDGPCNRERMEHHKRVHAEGAWVREAAAAFAQKKNQHTYERPLNHDI